MLLQKKENTHNTLMWLKVKAQTTPVSNKVRWLVRERDAVTALSEHLFADPVDGRLRTESERDAVCEGIWQLSFHKVGAL